MKAINEPAYSRLIPIICLVLVPLLFTTATAQERASAATEVASPTISAVAATDRVRISAPNSVVQMHVEIYSPSGQKLFDTEIRGGNVFDWHVQDGQAQRVAAADYVCVVTVKTIGGQLTQRIGAIRVDETTVTVATAERVALSAQQSQAIGPVEENASWLVLPVVENQTTTVMAHDGVNGQIVRGRGALTFRLGDFFAGNDQEQMRLTEEGNLGIGTTKPKFKLDVDGMIRARQGFVFGDGSTLKVNEKGSLTLTNSSGNVVSNLAGTGTQDKLARWTDNAGTLGDSLLSQAGGNVVNNGTSIQMTAPASNLIDTNLIFVNANDRTTGMIASNTPSFQAANGPYFAMRGNTYTAIGNQRGLFSMSAGNVANPTGIEGSVLFLTGNDQLRMMIKPDGNVGIGTNAPTFRLDVAGRVRLKQNIGSFNDTESAGMWLFQNTPNAERAFVGMRDDDHVGFFGNNGIGWGLVMNTQSGNVGVLGPGIGTFLPKAKFHVQGNSSLPSTPLAIIESFGDQIPLSFRRFSNIEVARIRADFPGNLILATIFGSSKDIHFRAGDDDTTDMIIRSSNSNVGIGTASPNAKLHVVGGDAAITTQGNGLILRAVDGPVCFRLVVNSAGTVVSVGVPCP